MRIETYTQRVLYPSDEHYLVNRIAKTVSDRVFLGVDADASEWEEVPKEEARIIMEEWEKEVEE